MFNVLLQLIDNNVNVKRPVSSPTSIVFSYYSSDIN